MRFKALIVASLFIVLFSSALFAQNPKIGDSNADINISVSDVVYEINFLFKGGPEPTPFKIVGDANCDGNVSVSDVVYLINYLFKGGSVPCHGNGMIYGSVTYTHLEGGVDSATIKVESSGPSTTSSDACSGGSYWLIGVPPNNPVSSYDPSDVDSDTTEVDSVSGVAGYIVQQDFALSPTVTITITGPRPPFGVGIGNQHWTRGCHQYVLQGECSVISGQALTIDPGVSIFADTSVTSFLAVQKGGKILADGTACLPIRFTSNYPVGQRAGGDWGGVILFGYSPMNTGTGVAEGNSGEFGCTPGVDCDEQDSSGVLRYVRVEFAGMSLGPDNELNGIAMYGVGSRTLIDYVQVHRNFDDGIEWFGGTNNVKHVYITECWDDHFDWTDGARFKAQFVALRGYGGLFTHPRTGATSNWGDRMVEADNQEYGYNLSPRSNPLICNITIVGGKEVRGGGFSNTQNMKMRHGTAFRVYNMINMDARAEGLDMQHETWFAFNPTVPGDTFPNGTIRTDTIDIDYAIFYNNTKNFNRRALDGTLFPFGAPQLCDPAFGNPGINSILFTNPNLTDPLNLTNPDFRPQAGSDALNPVNAINPATLDSFFDPTQYLGGFDATTDWTAGWSSLPDN